MILPLFFLLALLRHSSDALVGRWEGTSICIKADWNAACHDETIRYDVVRAAGRGDTLVVHAFKLVGGAYEPMGDLDATWDSAGRRWLAPFANSRVRIEWSYRLVGADLHGQVVTLPERRKARDVVARRVPAR